MKNKTLSLLLITALVLLGGCAHYHLGMGNKKLPYHSISFAPVVNHSMAPQVHTLVSDALFRAFASGGGMVVESQNSGADVTLTVTIEDFHKMIGATSSTDTGRARSLVMTMQANATLSDAEGKVISSQEFSVTQEVYADSGAARAESEGMPEITEALAQKIYRAVVSSW